MNGIHAAPSKVENSAQVVSCYLIFVHEGVNEHQKANSDGFKLTWINIFQMNINKKLIFLFVKIFTMKDE
jgi:hypothetical protein